MAVSKVCEGVWNLLDGGMVNSFLVVGSERALLIDTGLGNVELKPLIAEITDRPVTLVNTHGHGDHTGGNGQFGEFYISAEDIPDMEGDSSQAIAVGEGFKFNLGDRTLEVIETPGHTPGSISLIDRENKLVFVGDMLSKRPVYFIPGVANINSYIMSMDKLMALSADFDTVIVCHGDAKLNPEIIASYKETALAFAAGNLKHMEQCMGERSMAIYTADNGLGFISPL